MLLPPLFTIHCRYNVIYNNWYCFFFFFSRQTRTQSLRSITRVRTVRDDSFDSLRCTLRAFLAGTRRRRRVCNSDIESISSPPKRFENSRPEITSTRCGVMTLIFPRSNGLGFAIRRSGMFRFSRRAIIRIIGFKDFYYHHSTISDKSIVRRSFNTAKQNILIIYGLTILVHIR